MISMFDGEGILAMSEDEDKKMSKAEFIMA
jgi:hypothetical protein